MAPGQGPKPAQSIGEGVRRAIRESGLQIGLGMIAPFFLFYQLRQSVSLTAAIAAATIWSVGVIVYTWRSRGRFDLLTAGSLVFLLFNAGVGIWLQDATLYLALPAIEQVAFAVVLVGSVLIKRPFFGVIAAQMSGVPAHIAAGAAWRRAFSAVTYAWAAGAIARVALRLGMLAALGIDLFLLTYPVASWVLSGGLLLFTFWYPARLLREAGLGAAAPTPPDTTTPPTPAVPRPLVGEP